MIDEALDRLRESNPVPGEVNPAPIDALLARIQSEAEQEPRVRPHRHTRLLANLVPALAVGVAVAVAAVAIVVLAHRQRASVPATNGPPKVPIPLPRHGMLGVVAIDGATYAPGGLEMISVAQCFPCAGGRRRVSVTARGDSPPPTGASPGPPGVPGGSTRRSSAARKMAGPAARSASRECAVSTPT